MTPNFVRKQDNFLLFYTRNHVLCHHQVRFGIKIKCFPQTFKQNGKKNCNHFVNKQLQMPPTHPGWFPLPWQNKIMCCVTFKWINNDRNVTAVFHQPGQSMSETWEGSCRCTFGAKQETPERFTQIVFYRCDAAKPLDSLSSLSSSWNL